MPGTCCRKGWPHSPPPTHPGSGKKSPDPSWLGPRSTGRYRGSGSREAKGQLHEPGEQEGEVRPHEAAMAGGQILFVREVASATNRG